MSRLCRTPLAVALTAAATLLGLACGILSAGAQTLDSTDRFLLRPQIDGDARNPPRFRRPTQLTAPQPDTSRIGDLPDYDYQSGLGAGTSGFRSANTNARRQKGKNAPKGKSTGKAPTSGNAPPGSPSAGSAGATTPSSAAAPPPPLASPAVATAPTTAPARAPQYYLQRRGGPSYSGAGPSLDADGPLTAPASTNPSVRRRPALEDTPFDPVGIEAGAFLLRPAVELSGGYDSNAARTPAKVPSWFETVAPELLVNSNWQRHSLAIALRGSYSVYNNDHTLDRPSFDGRVNGRIDVTNNTRLDLEGRYLISTDNPGSPNLQAGIAKFPINTTLGGTFGVDQRFNRLDVSLKGLVDRTVYQESRLTDGTTVSNDDRNYNQYASQLRVGYELTPALRPFVEAGIDTRVHDLEIDRSGVHRDSDGWFARGGSTFEFSRTIVGEASVGWLMRTYQDPLLPDLSGATIDASLTWLASALTTIKLLAKTSANESVLLGVAGVFTREAGIEIDHAFRRWLIGTLRFTYDNDNYVGSPRDDNRYTASAAITYKLNRDMQLKGEYRREWLHSSIVGVDYLSNVYLLGLRLQK